LSGKQRLAPYNAYYHNRLTNFKLYSFLFKLNDRCFLIKVLIVLQLMQLAGTGSKFQLGIVQAKILGLVSLLWTHTLRPFIAGPLRSPWEGRSFG